MEPNYYSIGEAARIMGITVQTLRYYDKMGLVIPKHVNRDTGYRYYSFDQFHFIDRIRYLQELGLSLTDINKILSSGSVEQLLSFLKRKKHESERELVQLQGHIDDIQWYIDYFTYINDDDICPDIPYKLSLNKRYLAAVPCYPQDSSSDYHVRLNALRSSEEFQNAKFRRQFAYILDFDALMSKKLKREYLGMYLKETPRMPSENVIAIPAGEYLCFRGRILTEDWNPSLVSAIFENKETPSLVLSNEYEDSLMEYQFCMYEIQILLREIAS